VPIVVTVDADAVTTAVDIVNTARVTTSTPDPDPANDTSTVATLIVPDPGRLSGRVWNDADRDGVIDGGEVGFAGVTVTIVGDPDGDGVDDVVTAVTDASGAYAVDLPPGDWSVTLDESTLPFGTAATTGIDTLVSVPPNGSAEADFGRTFGSISGVVWIDADGDGVVDPGESGIDGVLVVVTAPGPDGELGTADDIVRSATTADGSYTVTDLPVGQSVLLRIDTSGLPDDVRQTFDPDGVLDGATALVVVGSGVGAVDFGYRATPTLAVTGADSGQLARLAALLLAAGWVLIAATRRRRDVATTSPPRAEAQSSRWSRRNCSNSAPRSSAEGIAASARRSYSCSSIRT
jgi:hypothetical protein